MANLLSKYFSGIGAKRLSEVEIKPSVSNQHEFNGIAGFKSIFGNDKIKFDGHFIFLPDDEEHIIEEDGTLTWYDARENHPTRTEYRLYYSSNTVIEAATPGDLIIIGRTGENALTIIVAPGGSSSEKQLLWLFGLKEVGNKFIVRDITTEDKELNFAGRYIINSLGFEIPEIIPDYLEQIIARFGTRFPKTVEFSDFARSTVKDISPVEEPDIALLTWLEKEELLFKTLESHIVAEKLNKGFGESGADVEDFISFSLSVQNLRKSRAGHAFENHLAHIFDKLNLKYSKGARTERNNKPDFLFPGITYYKTREFPADLLTMLGVKTTAKDRWRQVLSEAERIKRKHLITLEPAISSNQTKEMTAWNLQLIVPQPIRETYTDEQRQNILDLSEFIGLVREKQNKI